MKNNFLNSSFANINSKPSSNSEVLSQILYGEKFKILSKKKNWVKIQTSYDNYVGYIKTCIAKHPSLQRWFEEHFTLLCDNGVP